MDIIGAINKEREYLSFRMNGEDPYSFKDEIEKYGFQSIEEFVSAKRDYEFSLNKFDIIETNVENAINKVMNCIDTQRAAVLFATTDYTLVWNGNNGNYNVEYCTECNIPIYPLYTGGGTIVSTTGDLNVGICFRKDNRFDSYYILEKFEQIFKKYTDKTVITMGNDIIVDGYKVMGSTIYQDNEMFVFITPISMSDKKELICNICLKHSTKQPGHIDFMTADQLREEIEKWLKIA